MRSTSKIEWELALDSRYSDMYKKISTDKLRNLQSAYLQMFIDFEQECEKHGLISYMVAGTLIGALRHKGFIPWDDDIDLVMFREDYERLKTVFANHDKFFLVDPQSDTKDIHKMLKIQSKELTMYDVLGEGFSKKKYLYLDMLPIDFVPEVTWKRKLVGTVFKLLDLSYSSARCYKKYSPHLEVLSKGSVELKRNLLIRKIVAIPAMLIGPQNVFKMMENLLKRTKESSKITIAYGVKGYFGEILDYPVFYPSQKYQFENHLFSGPRDADGYLSNRYGDYMEIPDADEQVERHIRLRDDWEERIG